MSTEIEADNWSAKTAKRKTQLFTTNNAMSCEGAAVALLGGITDETSTSDLLLEVGKTTFLEYAEKNYNYERRGMFGAKTSTERIVNFKGNEVIKTSLNKLGDKELVAEAVQSFRNITGFMGDRSSGKNADDHCLKLLTTCLQSVDSLRNEVYCQLVKQTSKNPSLESTSLGWQLMNICLATFPPGPLLRDHLMAHCVAVLDDHPEPTVKKYAESCLHNIPLICELGPRRELPTLIEMECCKRLKPVVVRVSFLDYKYAMIPVNSWTTVEHFHEIIRRRLGIKDGRSFAVYEVSSNEEERSLDKHERILDLVAYWNRLQAEERAKKGKNAEVETFSFLFKAKLFFEMKNDDHAGVEMMYIQAKHDVVDARYPCTDQDAITLAALQVQEEFGDHPGGDSPCSYITGKLHKFVTAKVLEGNEADSIESSIMKLYAKLTGYSQQEARLSYLDYVKSWKIFGSMYYFAEPICNKMLPNEVVIAINNKGILVVDPNSKEFLEEFPYNKVVTWGASDKAFSVVAGDLVHNRKVFFKTNQGKEMSRIVRAYVDSIILNLEISDQKK
jgi:myosin-7